MTRAEFEYFYLSLTFDDSEKVRGLLGNNMTDLTSFDEDHENLPEGIRNMDLKTFCMSYLLIGGTLKPGWQRMVEFLDKSDDIEYTAE